MARGFRSVRGGKSQRRLTTWGNFTMLSDSIASVGGTNLISTSNAALLALRPFTIIRSHLMVSVTSDQIIASEDQVGAVGLAVVSEQASGIGVSAVPVPVDDQGSDLFFMHMNFAYSYEFQGAPAVSNPNFANVRWIDSKGARKVNDDQDIVLVAQLASFSDGVGIVTGGRFLLKLH